MIPTAQVVRGAVTPAFEIQLLNEDGTAPDLTGKTVTFFFQTPGCCGSRKIQSTPTVIDARGGYISHAWLTAETNVEGIGYAHVVVTAIGQDPLAYPTADLEFWPVRILPQPAATT